MQTPSTHRARRAAAMLLVAATLAQGPALAEPSVADREAALALYKEGSKLLETGHPREATEQLRKAHALFPTPVVGLELARAYEGASMLLEALEAAQRAAEMDYPDTDKTKAARGEALALASRVRRRVPLLRVSVSGLPASAHATLRLDDAPASAESLTQGLRVRVGKHTAVAHAEGHPDQRGEIEAKEGQTHDLKLAFPADVAPPPASASPVKPLPSATSSEQPPPPPAPGPESPGPSLRTGGFIVAGVGVAGLLAGTLFGLRSRSRHSEALDHCPDDRCDEAAPPLQDQAKSAATLSNVGFVAGGLLLAGGITMVFLAPSGNSAAAAARITPSLGQGFLGLSAQGRF